MSDFDDQLLEEEYWVSSPVDASDVDQVIEHICTTNKKLRWKSKVPLELKTTRWIPAAVSASGKEVLHVCLTGSIPRFVASRLCEAFNSGIRVHIALTLNALYSAEVVEFLATVDANVFLLTGSQRIAYGSQHFLAAMADESVPSPPSLRVVICRQVHGRLGSGTKQEKGKRLEALLAYLLSQVSDFRVVERNLRTATQELDIVLQIDRHSDRSWQQGVPYLLVEAKNWKDPVPQSVVSVLMTKINTKGQSCKMALLITTGDFTEDAKMEELRYSMTENRIALIAKNDLASLIEAEDLDETLDGIVRRARLR